jgi:prepilin-type N-terminal cleavage/methylation domain-containing protein
MNINRILKNRGFTLVELLVVISIIALLLSILMPSLSMARDQSKKVACMGRMKQIQLGFLMYSDNNSGKLPTIVGTNVNRLPSEAFSLALLWPNYLGDQGVFKCPGARSSDEETITLTNGKSFTVSYLYQDSAVPATIGSDVLCYWKKYKDRVYGGGIPLLCCRTNTTDFPSIGYVKRFNHGGSGLTKRSGMNLMTINPTGIELRFYSARDDFPPYSRGITNYDSIHFIYNVTKWRGWNHGASEGPRAWK